MNADEIRAKEDLPEIPGGDGKIFVVNGAMIPLSEVKNNRPKAAQNLQKGGDNSGNPQ